MVELLAESQQLEEELSQIVDYTQGRSLARFRMNGRRRTGCDVNVCMMSIHVKRFIALSFLIALVLFLLLLKSFPPQEVEQLRMERLQIDEQLRQITQGHRPADRERGDRGDAASASSSSSHISRSYNSRGRGRRGHSYSTGYGPDFITAQFERINPHCSHGRVSYCSRHQLRAVQRL